MMVYVAAMIRRRPTLSTVFMATPNNIEFYLHTQVSICSNDNNNLTI